MKLSEFLIQYRANNNLSQRQFAERCNISNAYISMIENELNPKTGKPAVPTLSMLKKLSSGMGISLDDLLNEIEEIEIRIDHKKISANPKKTEKIISLLSMLTSDELDNAINYIGFLLSQRGDAQDSQ